MLIEEVQNSLCYYSREEFCCIPTAFQGSEKNASSRLGLTCPLHSFITTPRLLLLLQVGKAIFALAKKNCKNATLFPFFLNHLQSISICTVGNISDFSGNQQLIFDFLDS